MAWWLSPSLSVKQPCGWLSPINHVYYCSAEYQKTHQIASYMWPGNMPGERRGDDNSSEMGDVMREEWCWQPLMGGAGILSGMACGRWPSLLASHWSLTRKYCARIGQRLPTHDGRRTVTLTVARITELMWSIAWAQAHHMSHCYCLLFIRTTTKRACRKII